MSGGVPILRERVACTKAGVGEGHVCGCGVGSRGEFGASVSRADLGRLYSPVRHFSILTYERLRSELCLRGRT